MQGRAAVAGAWEEAQAASAEAAVERRRADEVSAQLAAVMQDYVSQMEHTVQSGLAKA